MPYLLNIEKASELPVTYGANYPSHLIAWPVSKHHHSGLGERIGHVLLIPIRVQCLHYVHQSGTLQVSVCF